MSASGNILGAIIILLWGLLLIAVTFFWEIIKLLSYIKKIVKGVLTWKK